MTDDLLRRPPPRGMVLDLWNTLAHHHPGPNPLLALGRTLGVADRSGWVRTIETAIMRRRFSCLAEALPVLEQAFELSPDPAVRQAALEAWTPRTRSVTLFPEVLPVLRGLREAGLRLALLSNTQSFDLAPIERSGLPGLLHTIHLSCDTGLLKPQPRAFREVVRALDLTPGEVLMVGDNLKDDVRAAREAGLRAVLLRREAPGLSHRESRSGEPWVGDLRELAGRLEIPGFEPD